MKKKLREDAKRKRSSGSSGHLNQELREGREKMIKNEEVEKIEREKGKEEEEEEKEKEEEEEGENEEKEGEEEVM
ncbi:uncharacterized protein MONOS_3560 [Monocercomonoides exilis]|uniref:uncharacterized protein n=1 Tax=Monocercomonoides exilis TaxID=2049356 RepID=UPI0035596631|nr:hypothetical protein MONOS_3560 [Monocercomonoides exilis]|eukprot:MONOS_3560.1-p1 / transcript=MONOS_3560.1 / gene=MONOS_3560 / organism=Monocercomonoides_exilis_PA203 / gene_product=unspecified product / transcript_product=unspecified product / location=Mono_scaffold00084:113664-113888(+) / protein_length=75 / sequence_SO=supercontig / SO=protein_coding / is_pseudo=false